MKTQHLIRRCLLLIVGLFIMAYGVSLSIQAGLGTSPISSLPFTLSQLTPLTVGTATIAMHAHPVTDFIVAAPLQPDPAFTATCRPAVRVSDRFHPDDDSKFEPFELCGAMDLLPARDRLGGHRRQL